MAGAKVEIEILMDNTDEILSAFKDAAKLAVEKCGIQAESHAVDYITSEGAIDTGLLRNSITSAVGGQKARIDKYTADRESSRTGKKPPSGKYTGTAPNDEDMQYTVYIGSNVYYAPLTI